MAPSRPFWKGYLKLSLVSCPIAMFPASSSSERVSFRQINKSTGNRLKQQLVDSVTGDVIESGQKGRGYEIGRNQFMPVEDEELEALRLESTHTIDIEKFVPRSEIDERYLDSPYYLVPEDKVPIIAPGACVPGFSSRARIAPETARRPPARSSAVTWGSADHSGPLMCVPASRGRIAPIIAPGACVPGFSSRARVLLPLRVSPR